MSSAEHLREFISQRLTAAAEEIFSEFQKTIGRYEEEVGRLDVTWKPGKKLRTADLPQHFICDKQLPADQRLRNQDKDSGSDREEPEPTRVKEEEGELCPSTEAEPLVLKQEADGFMVTPMFEESEEYEPEPSGEQLLSQSFGAAESSGQEGSRRRGFGSAGEEELKPKRRRPRNSRNTNASTAEKTETVTLDLEAVPASSSLTRDFSFPSLRTPPQSGSSQLWAARSRPSTPQMLKTWPETFQVPWEQMPQEIRSAVAEGKRPKPVERRKMVRVLAEEMRRYETHPTRTQCLTVVQNIVRQHPRSFADMTPSGSLLSGGYTSLLIQLKNRIENVNRAVGFSRHRRSKQKRGPSDTYGCARFQPGLPPGETEETVEQRRRRLVEIYSREGGAAAESAEVRALMELSFCLQRRHINTLPPPDLADLRARWPFLCTPPCIYAHFELLTDVDALRSLELSVGECGSAITQFFREKPTNKAVRDAVSEGQDGELTLRVVRLLMAHFGEDLSGLILLADPAADIEMTLRLPASPRLILHVSDAAGQLTVGGWRISLAGRVISEGVAPTFAAGLAAVFAIYYIFNLQYQDEAACTLEFIQRRFIGINPERGSKAKRGKVVSKKKGVIVQKKSSAVNTQVSRLLKDLLDFEWDFI
ncbi:uncharacterized protein PAE49_016642 [Odontesthes bonariensis]|uniref:uncharacterized protein LOC142400867 n=1 Tax=Odontesthes bonariensis TaxID=219752 RepID=UPI003F58A06A